MLCFVVAIFGSVTTYHREKMERRLKTFLSCVRLKTNVLHELLLS
jgi:hypothetical protein